MKIRIRLKNMQLFWINVQSNKVTQYLWLLRSIDYILYFSQ